MIIIKYAFFVSFHGTENRENSNPNVDKEEESINYTVLKQL